MIKKIRQHSVVGKTVNFYFGTRKNKNTKVFVKVWQVSETWARRHSLSTVSFRCLFLTAWQGREMESLPERMAADARREPQKRSPSFDLLPHVKNRPATSGRKAHCDALHPHAPLRVLFLHNNGRLKSALWGLRIIDPYARPRWH